MPSNLSHVPWELRAKHIYKGSRDHSLIYDQLKWTYQEVHIYDTANRDLLELRLHSDWSLALVGGLEEVVHGGLSACEYELIALMIKSAMCEP